MPGDILQKYGTSNQTITITLASLGSGSFAVSNAIQNSSNFSDVLVEVQIKTGGSGAAGPINIFVLGSVDGGTTYPTDSTNYRRMGSFWANSTATTYVGGPFSVAQAIGVVPEYFKIAVQNSHGGTLDATAGNHSAVYQGQYFQYT